MAYVYVNSGAFINMLNPQTWYGNVTRATSTEITITDNYYTASYSGFGFVYSGSNVVGGTLTGYSQYYLGSLLGYATGLSVSASLAASYIQSNNLPGLLSIALSGNDTLDLANGDDTAVSYGGNDIISAGDGNDLIYAGDGNDNILGGVGADWIDGGSGFDYARYDFSASGVYVRLDTGQGYSGEANGDHLVSIEGLVGSAFGDDLRGDANANWIEGGEGANTIVGGPDSSDAADRLISGSGSDLIFGNGGADFIDPGGGADTLVGGFGSDLIVSGAGNDIILSSQDNDAVNAGDGADIVVGGFGDDSLYGGAGNDTLFGSEGNDTVVGSTGADRYVFLIGSGNDQIFGFVFGDGDRLDLGGQTYTRGIAGDGDALLLLSGGGTIELNGVTPAGFSPTFVL